MTGEHGAVLIAWARASIAQALGGPHATPPDDAWLREHRGTFVTLRWKHDGDLQGCIGNLGGDRELVADIASNAVAAATRDPRSEPIALADLAELDVEVSVLTPLELIDGIAAIQPGDGVVIEWHGRRATFLPIMWETFPDKPTFVGQLLRKAGIARSVEPDIQVWRYTAERFES
ncbi:MAG TPA: AmmeMemoRadiSam system protein A [Kofleriaceae bacterium]